MDSDWNRASLHERFVLTFGFGSGSWFGSRFEFGDAPCAAETTNNEPQTSKAGHGIPD
jgi:hypothetical protein